MKTKILQEKIQAAVSNIEKITGKDATLPILNNILLKLEKNNLIMSATNLETGILWKTTSKNESEGDIVLPAQIFSALIGSFPGGVVEIEVNEKTTTIINDKKKVKLNGYSTDEFPIIPINNQGEFITIRADLFCQSLARVVNFTGNSSVKPEITGVYMLFSNDSIKFVATDSFRLGEQKINQKNKSLSKEYPIIIPLRAAREIISVFQNNKNNIDIYFNQGRITINYVDNDGGGEIQFTSRLIDGDFPDYQAIIPASFVTRGVFQKKDLLNQLKPAGIFSGKNNEVEFRIDVNRLLMTIFSRSADFGDYEGGVEIKDLSGREISIVFNLRFLVDGLNVIKDDECVFEFSGNDGPCVLKSANDENFIYIIMPIKKY